VRPLLLLLSAAPLLGAAFPGQPPPASPEAIEGGAWLKVFAIRSGSPEPVLLSELEVNALLQSVQLAAFLTEQAGLTEVQVELLPDEVQLTGRVAVERLGAALGPFAPPPGTPPQPVNIAVRVRGSGGSGEVAILRGAVAGMELPPQVIAEAVLGGLAGISESGLERVRGPILEGAPFPLPAGLDGIELRAGEVVLLPTTP
jgi:hypothetical protein